MDKDSTAKTAGKSRGLGVFTLAVMNVAAVVSLRGLPSEAGYGLGSIFYYLFAAVVFLIPVALISAELAAAFPQKGGVYRWVGEAGCNGFKTLFGFRRSSPLLPSPSLISVPIRRRRKYLWPITEFMWPPPALSFIGVPHL